MTPAQDPHGFVPAATVVRTVPGTRLSASVSGSVVHIAGSGSGSAKCGRDRTSVALLPADQPAPVLRVCEDCLHRLAAAARLQLRAAATDEERTAVREHAARQHPDPLSLPVPSPTHQGGGVDAPR